MKKACKRCKIIFTEDKCPICDSINFTDGWKGRVIMLNSKESEISKKLKINKDGEYAIKTK